MNKLVSMT